MMIRNPPNRTKGAKLYEVWNDAVHFVWLMLVAEVYIPVIYSVN